MLRRRFVPILLTVALVGSSCNTNPYYKALEKIGIEKRELLVRRVAGARDAQKDAQEQFRDALEKFKALVGYEGGELEARYEKLRKEYEDSAARAGEVRKKIVGVKDVAGELFKEWEKELGQYSDDNLKRESQRELDLTKRRYRELVTVMEASASRMEPVLTKLHDQVLFLKHNLNARVLGSLRGTADKLETDVDALVKEMEASISEATRFIDEMGKEKTR